MRNLKSTTLVIIRLCREFYKNLFKLKGRKIHLEVNFSRPKYMFWGEKSNFAASFMCLKLKRKNKKVYMEVRDSKEGLESRVVNKHICSSEGGDSLFLRLLHLDAWKQWTGLA